MYYVGSNSWLLSKVSLIANEESLTSTDFIKRESCIKRKLLCDGLVIDACSCKSHKILVSLFLID